MADQNEGMGCSQLCWLIALLVGIVVAIILLGADWSWLLAILCGAVICVVLGLGLLKLACSETAANISATTAPSATKVATAAAPTAVAAEPAPKEEPAAPAPEPKAAPAAAAKPKAPAKKKAAPAKKAAPKAAAKAAKPSAPARKPVAKDGKPELLTKARGGKADDLKMIKGVGPGLEKKLNDLGIYHYDQVAGLRKKEIGWVDDQLSFKGRIERDEWVKQAKVLARGGSTEFASRAKKDGTYKK